MDTKKKRIPAILVDSHVYSHPIIKSQKIAQLEHMLPKVSSILLIDNEELDTPSAQVLENYDVIIRNTGKKPTREFKQHAFYTILDMSNMQPVIVFDETYDLATLTMYDTNNVLEVIR